MIRHVFGPVPSRRLGRSLGIDLVPFKTCTYDCIYCQLGATENKTIERKRWVSWEPILEEVERKLDSQPDYITFSGSGEPTLCEGLGEMIRRIRTITRVPIAVLTNGSLLWRADVRQDLREADLVIPSLDAGDEALFRQINRPHDSLSFAQLIEGLVAFRDEFRGGYWLEVFLLAGHTSIDAEVSKIADHIRRIRPDRVQLNTVTRPPAERFAEAVPPERLSQLAGRFHPPGEMIAEYAQVSDCASAGRAGCEDILEMLHRRPCSVHDVTAALGLHINEAIKCLDVLTHLGMVEQTAQCQGIYYRAVRAAHITGRIAEQRPNTT